MTSCESIREMLVAWLDGELSAGDAVAVQQHVESCSACADEVALFRATQSAITRALSRTAAAPADQRDAGFAALLREVEGDPPQVEVETRSGSRHAASPALRRAATRWRIRTVLSGALAAGLAAVLFWYGSPGGGPTSKSVPASGGPVASSTSASGSGATRVARDASGSNRGATGAPARSNVLAVDAPADDDAAKNDLQVPDELRRRPGFFLDYPIVHRLEKLRRLEATNAVPDPTTNGDAG
jgi:anti-sigma factor RsiW